jgi:hypothetical protein
MCGGQPILDHEQGEEPMGFKSGLVIGFGAGYVLGTRAGRERYQDIKRMWGGLVGSPTVQKAAGRTKEVAEEGARRGLDTVQTGVERAGSAVRERLHRSNDEATDRIVGLVEDQEGQSPQVVEGGYREVLTTQTE